MKIFKGILVSSIALTAFNGVGGILPSEKSEVAYAATYNYSNKQLNSTVHKQATKQLILKFKNEANLPYQDGIEKFIKEEKQDPEFIGILAEYPNVTINRLFNSLNPKEIKNLGKEIKDSDHISSNLLNYYIVETQDGIDVQALLTKLRNHLLLKRRIYRKKRLHQQSVYQIYLLTHMMSLDLKDKVILNQHH